MIDDATFDRLSMFTHVNADARKVLMDQAVLRRLAGGEVLWTTGARPRGLFIVIEGTVRVVRSTRGRQHVLHQEGPGGTLGEIPLFEGGDMPATAVAAEPTTCVVISREAIRSAIQADPDVGLALLQRLARRARSLVERVDGLAALQVRHRIAGLLLERHEASDGRAFTLGSSQAVAAEEIGTVREVLVRCLREFRETGLIRSVGRGRFEVVDERRLRDLASF